MGDVTLKINGQDFEISCDSGQEERVHHLGEFINMRLNEIRQAGAANSDTHLLVLTALILADEVFDLRDYIHSEGKTGRAPSAINEPAIAKTIETLATRIENIAEKIYKAA